MASVSHDEHARPALSSDTFGPRGAQRQHQAAERGRYQQA